MRMNKEVSSTIEYYNSNADTFFNDTVNADMRYCLDRFLDTLEDKEGSIRILDAGCGSGRDTKYFLEEGFLVDAFDASEEMCRKASEYTGIDVKCMSFEEFEEENIYDGIWACASLLHVERDRLEDILVRLGKGLTGSGKMYASFKKGEGDRIKEGRYFTDMTEDSARELFEEAGLKVLDVFVTGDVRDGRVEQQWVNVIAEK